MNRLFLSGCGCPDGVSNVPEVATSNPPDVTSVAIVPNSPGETRAIRNLNGGPNGAVNVSTSFGVNVRGGVVVLVVLVLLFIAFRD